MANYTKTSAASGARVELHDALGITGAEISVNRLPAGGSVPFVHAHKQNEEIYLVFEGAGEIVLDGERVPLAAGDALLVKPAARRQIFASSDAGIGYVCVQVKEHSLDAFTAGDAVVE